MQILHEKSRFGVQEAKNLRRDKLNRKTKKETDKTFNDDCDHESELKTRQTFKPSH